MKDFSQFGLCGPILNALARQGYTSPTPIQQQAIPPVVAGRDVCGIAQTGTGKTAAFALPVLHRLAASGGGRNPDVSGSLVSDAGVGNTRLRKARACRVLVLAPTRELASQIGASFKSYGSGLGLRTAVIFGGVSQGRQVEELARGVDILVATPGRLLDLVDQRLLTLAHVEVLVVDEADQMLDLGFIVPLRRIVKLVPAKRQTLFFSATMPKTIARLADDILRDPVQVAVAPVATTVERVEQGVVFVATAEKQALLAKILADPGMERVLVFTRTKHGADKVVRNLGRAGIQAHAIHGNKSQPQREKALAGFKSGATRVLVATDIAARGIHVETVSHVVNFDLPNVPESYVHRIGRTARAGAAGVAISFCNGEERAYLRDIEKLTRRKIPVIASPASVAAADPGAHRDEPRRQELRSNARRRQPAGGGPKAQPHGSQRTGRHSHERHARDNAGHGLPAFLTRPQRRGSGGA